MNFTKMHYLTFALGVLLCGVLTVLYFKKNNEPVPHGVTLNDFLHYDGSSVESIRRIWIPYYHRHKKLHEAKDVFNLLIEKSVLTGQEHRFFEMLFSNTDHYQLYKDKIVNLGEFQVTESDTAWAGYAYSGDLSYVDEYMNLLVSPNTDDEAQLSIESELVVNASLYHPLYMHIAKLAQSRQNALNVKLLPVFNYVRNKSYNPSTTLRKQAKNHLAAGDVEEALVSLRASHDYFSDNPYTYYTLGRVLLKENNPVAAIDAFKISNWLYEGHNDKVVCYYIAYTYDQIGDLENTIKYYQIAIDLDPNYESAIVNIAWALMRAGQKEETIKYANRIIELSSDSKNLAWARETLHELGADVSIADRKQKEVQNDIQNLFDTGQFAKMEEQLAEADRQKTVDEDGRLLIYSLYDKFIPSNTSQKLFFERDLPKISKWVTENPDSHFANASAGMFYINYAWNARGTGYAGSITEKSSELFHARMTQAGEYLVKAYNLLPTDSSVPCNMITVANITPDATGNKSSEDWYNLGNQAYSDDPGPAKMHLFFLAPEWGGSHVQQFEFARSVIENSSDTSTVSQMIPSIHWSVYNKSQDPDYFKNPAVWDELSTIYSKLLSLYPNSMKFHNGFAKVAYYAGQIDIAQQEFAIIGDNWEQSVWYTKDSFEKARGEVL